MEVQEQTRGVEGGKGNFGITASNTWGKMAGNMRHFPRENDRKMTGNDRKMTGNMSYFPGKMTGNMSHFPGK